MSGPYRFNQEQSRSPLDRQPPNLFPAGQPPSFKTNVNRAKTKKWVEAKPYSYDGDDWGEYDEYDEYGAEEAAHTAPPPPPTGLRQPGQRAGEPSRSFTEPHRQLPPQAGRRNSFEAGDEHQAFSAAMPEDLHNGPPSTSIGQAGYAHDPHQPYAQQAPVQPSNRQASTAESDYSDTPQHRRDFSPTAMPPPLNTRFSPAPSSAGNSPANTMFPPRKSSISQGDSPIVAGRTGSPMSPRDRAPSNPQKPLPFIRPADIYKRMEEERQRASLDSSRPSMDSLASRPREDVTATLEPSTPVKTADAGKTLQPLESVAERKSEYLPDFVGEQKEPPHTGPSARTEDLHKTSDSTQQFSLPQVESVSGFDNNVWAGDAPLQKSHVNSPPEDQGFRAVVDKAFTRTDDQRSVPPTPISKESDSLMSRSDTNSTSGISPIMSRVPSSAVSALKNRSGADSSTPAIAEEGSESSTPAVSRPVSAAMLGGGPYQVPRKPSPSHSRNISDSSMPRAGLPNPSPGESPARSPAVEPQKFVPEPEAARLSMMGTNPLESMDGGAAGQSPSYATREADIASAARMSPEKSLPVLGAEGKESQATFLDSHHNADNQLSDIAPRTRSESPSKSRVQELAGKFGDVSHSRRGSTQSSVQSWEHSRENSRPSSPIKADANRPITPVKESAIDRPIAGRETSFRPKLPGQWESFATTAPTPSDVDEKDGFGTTKSQQQPAAQSATSPLHELDLTPTTSKHPVAVAAAADPISDPIAALKAAGTAMGQAFQETIGLGPSASAQGRDHEEPSKGRSFGDIYPARPMQLDRTVSSVASSMPPTPPAKDSPESEELPPPPPLKDTSPEPASPVGHQRLVSRPAMVPQLSTDPSVDDQESDRLRKEIVASLSPQKSVGMTEIEPTQSSLQPIVPGSTNRESSLLPSEYDSYWADGDQVSPRPSNDFGGNRQEHSPIAFKPVVPQESDAGQPSLLTTRFSWEDRTALAGTGEQQALAGANIPPVEAQQEEGQPTLQVAQQSRDTVPEQSFEGIPDPYFGPGHVAAVAKPDPVTDSEFAARSLSPSADSAKPAEELTPVPTIRETSPPSGLHVVNSALNPEAVDMPPRLSAEISPPSPILRDGEEKPSAPSDVQGTQDTTAMMSTSASEPRSSLTQAPATQSPTSDKPLGFREIVTIPSPSERIATYNKTREYWATADHGLHDWISSAVAANPHLASQTLPSQQPALGHSGTNRHKPTPSLSLFGKHHGASNAQQTTPYYEQYNSAASQVPSTPTSATAPTPQGSNSKETGGRSTSYQMQSKGKDLLHSAGVLGGKGMTGAKGLFAKGKSRFGGKDKAARSHSVSSSHALRDLYDEPELVLNTTTPPRAMTLDFESTSTEKKKRRFSSPFHRTSRSRSRPTSIVLPQLDLGSGFNVTPRDTPLRETPPTEGGSRRQSFQVPDSWNVVAGEPQHPYGTKPATPPQGGLQPSERLGVLPSPAKSAFSLIQQDNTDQSDIPPVPPLPAGLEHAVRDQEGQDAASHRVLQSVIRYSTPPNLEASYLPKPAPVAQHGQDASLSGEDNRQRKVKEELKLAQEERAVNNGQEREEENGLFKELLPQEPLTAVHAMDVAASSRDQRQDEAEDDLPPRLNHEPVVPTLEPPVTSSHVDISPPHGAASDASEGGEISPIVSSTTTAGHTSEEDDDAPPRLDLGFLMQGPQPNRDNVSPVKAPTKGDNGRAEDDPHTPIRTAEQRQKRPAWETLQIGGDVSPVSAIHDHDHDHDDDAEQDQVDGAQDSTPTKINEASSSAQTAGEGHQGAPGPGPAPPGTAPPLLAPPVATQQQRVSAKPYQVVHAVQYVPSRSHSSLESWEQDSVAPSHSDGGSQVGDKRDEGDIPPVPLVPSRLQQREPVDASPKLEPKVHHPTPVVIPSKEQPTARSVTLQRQGLQPSMDVKTHPGGHQRSQSLLSAISSAVLAEGPSGSPVSSQPRSRPSSSQRHQPASPVKAPVVPVSITTGAGGAVQKLPGIDDDDDYDLYADHNGVVKGVHDEKGQPLRVATAQTAQGAAPPPVQATQAAASQPAAEEDARRYSDERPMSFIFGPRDANGRPQDQINKPTPTSSQTNIPPVPHIPEHVQQIQYEESPVDPTYIPRPSNYVKPALPAAVQTPNVDAIPQRQDVSPLLQNQQPQPIHTPARSEVSPPLPSSASPPPQPTPPPVLAQRAFLQGQQANAQAPATRSPDPRAMADPRLKALAQGKPLPREPRVRTPNRMYIPDPRSPQAPRGQHELHQQLMQRQTVDPRLRGAASGPSGAGSLQAGPPAAKQNEKASSLPKLGAVLKGFGKPNQGTRQSTNITNGKVNPDPIAPGDPSHSDMYQSSGGGLPSDQVTTKREKKTSVWGSLGHRPQSIGAESHFSQDSTRVQPADSRLDLRYPSTPAPLNGTPPPQPLPLLTISPDPPQSHRSSSSGTPESSKKKRFSALSGLFSRNSSGDAKPPKMTKEEKKAQKAHRHSTVPPPQSHGEQQWPQQQYQQHQQIRAPQPYADHLGHAPPAARPFPGMQGVAPQPMSSQNISSQGFSSHGVPQHYMYPQGFPQQQMQQPNQARNGSAYLDTRRIAVEHQQHPVPQPFQHHPEQSRPDMSHPNSSYVQTTQHPAHQGHHTPLGGYYIPDSKHPVIEPDVARRQNLVNQQTAFIPQQPSNNRRVSAPISPHEMTNVAPISQRHVSAPLAEPQYDTPQIPAAYTQVTGGYVSPSTETPTHNFPPTQPQLYPGGVPRAREYSDPQMQPISPQISEQSQPPNQRSQSDSSVHSVVSPISNPSPGMPVATPALNQRLHKPRMSSISEATHQERPWDLNLREGATEQEIVRARHQQYMQQQIAAQQQLNDERHGKSPSPNPSRQTQSPSPQPPPTLQQHHSPKPSSVQGFREVLPRTSPQPYTLVQTQQGPGPEPHLQEDNNPSPRTHSPLRPLQPAPIRPEQGLNGPAAYPLPTSPASLNPKSPVNPIADALPPPPPPKIPHSPMQSGFPTDQPQQSQPQQVVEHTPPQQHILPGQQYQSPPSVQASHYEQQLPDEPPPSYDGPGIANDGMDKDRLQPQEGYHPANIMTDAEIRGREREREFRQRQISLGLLQHPQPASMAASPSRTSADMGADILRRQLLEQEERDREERLQQAELQRADTERERHARDQARARARELERSVSGGARVSSLRSVGGSGRGRGPGWERRRGSIARPVYELPAEEDEEPVMRATSFPGQEWVPTWTED